MRTCRALIFDFDGVIVESEPIKTLAFQILYREYGPEVVAAAVAHHEANGGIPRRTKIRHCHKMLLDIELNQEELDRLCRQFSALVEGKVVASDWVPGAKAALFDQFGRRPMFIVSGTPQDEITRILERRGMKAWFVEAHGSPPDKATTIRGILARHGLDRRAVLFVGDAAADWRAARETGVRFLGRLADPGQNPFPAGTPVISDLTQLVP